jgi:nucleotide-binding universal stress UspA family protein
VTEETNAGERPAVPSGAVLLCYDGSDASKHALAVAHEIAGNRPALVLHLWEPPAAGWMTPDAFGGMPVWGSEMTELDTVLRERSGRLLADGVRLAREAGFDAQGRLEANPGAEWRAILDIADEIDAGLVVLGARGLTVVQSALLGSVSNAVLHHAKRPVLVVPALS